MAEPGDWELSKENIQPLRQGRTMSSLQTALAPQCQPDLKQKRREFEQKLRTTSGAELLDVWHRYILWVEQHYPSGGHEVNLVQLMEQAMAHFVKAEEFHNDERYVGIWIRYALKCQHPLEVCKTMYDGDIGTSHAAFFIAWSNHLEAAGDVRRAGRVLRVAIDRKAQPVDDLERALRHLEARVGQSVAQQVREQAPPGEEEVRTTLAPLATQGKRGAVTIARTGPVARPAEPAQGGLAMVSAGSAAGNRGHTKVRVRSDENDENTVFLAQPAAAVVAAPQSAKENSVAPGKWAGAKAKQRLPAPPAQAKFEIPEDTELPPPPCTPVVIPGSRQALSVRKEPELDPEPWDTWVVPVMRPDPPGLRTRPMYDKSSVYRGTTEFQFEELRMAAYCGWGLPLGDGRAQAAESARVQQLEDELLELRREVRELRSLLATTRPSGDDRVAVKNRVEFLEQSILVAERSTLAAGLAAPENGPDYGAGEEEEEEKEAPSSPTGMPESGVVTPGSTASSPRSTTDVSRVVRSLWNGTLGQSGVEPPTSPTQPQSCTDAAPAMAGKTSPGVEQCAGNPVVAPFQVFTEPTVTGAVFPDPGFPTGPPMQEGDENRPPTNYSQPPLPHSRAEGLKYRTPFAELEPEPLPDDEDADGGEDEEDVIQGVEPLAEETDFTYAPSKSFVRKVTSTPLTTGVPGVGEDFTVGGLTAMVQAVAIAGAPAATQQERQSPVPPPQQPSASVPEAALAPTSGAAPPEDPTVTAAKRRFSVAAAGDLSTIFECSKEGKSSGSSSSGSSGASSAHSVGATLSRGVSGMLPAVQEEEPQQQPSAVHQGEEVEHQQEEYQDGCPEEQEEEEEMEAEAEEAMAEEGRGGFSVDPFSDVVRNRILCSWEMSESDQARFHELDGNRPTLKADAHITLGGQLLKVVRHLAAGSFARVYLAETVNPEETFLDDTSDISFQAPVQTKVVLKLDAKSYSGKWEFYITCELARRLREAYSNGWAVNCMAELLFGSFYSSSSILVFPYSCYGTLLDLVSRYRKQGKGFAVPECLVLYLALELITTVGQVHTCGIIHADIKPDNVLVRDLPSEAGFLDRFSEIGVNCVQLIDFGRAIDMTALPAGTVFTQVIETDSFQCTEMLSGRPWTFQLDWFGVLGCLHVLLFGDYMAVEQLADGRWAPRLKFKRYWQQDLWSRLFSTLLNIPSCTEHPDMTPFVLEIKKLLLNRSRAHDVVMEALRAKNL